MTEGEWHKKTREQIVKFLKKEKKGCEIKESHDGKKNPLYQGEISNGTHLSDADIVVIEDGKVPYIIEIEGKTSPKTIIGTICATNLCDLYFYKGREAIIDRTVMFIVTKHEIVYKKGSKKVQQFSVIKENLKPKNGTIKDYVICTENEFEDKFSSKEVRK